MADKFKFEILSTHKKSRRGVVKTIHGDIETPAFMPVGTRGSVKAMLPETVKKAGADIILGNVYHLMLRPTAELVDEMGGLRKFMNWNGPILTDSGGFQVMSLSDLCKITEEGVKFSSHIDGSKHMLTPERSTEIQFLLDSTITMIFDQCIKYPSSYNEVKSAMELSNRWATRSRKAFKIRDGYGQFGIMQGGMNKDLREESAKHLVDLDFEGYAIGGLAVGEGQEKMLEVLDYAPSLLPESKSRYLMGVGKPSDIIEAVKRGVDMFDCVIPTRSGRNGQVFTKNGTMNIKNSKFNNDKQAIEDGCDCTACTNYTRSYLHHMFKSGEIIASMLLTEHNIYYYQRLMRRIRDYISAGKDIDFNA